MPELLTQPNNAQNLTQVAGMKSECRPASNRNGGRLHVGISGRHQSESAAGIMLGDFAPARQQSGLFSTRDALKSARAMAALDAVNARFGSGTLRPAATGMIKAWAGRQARHSPRYTTSAEEMLVAKAF